MVSENKSIKVSFIFFILLLSLFILSKQFKQEAFAVTQKLICPTSGPNQNGLQMVGCTVPTDIPTVFVAKKSSITPPVSNSTGGNTSSGKVPLYKQWDPRWGSLPFGYCGTDIASSGCGPTSLAMVISYLTNKAVLPPQTAKQALHKCGEGMTYTSIAIVPTYYGLRSKLVSWDEAKRYLKQGIPIINVQGPGYFTGHGHYIVLTGINANGTFAINDPDGFHRTQATEAQIVASRGMSWVITK